MTADFNTKPLQGSKFVQFRNQLQGISIDDCDSYRHYYKKIMIGYKLFDDQENNLFPKAWIACRSVLEIKGIKYYPRRSNVSQNTILLKVKERNIVNLIY